VIQNDGRTPLVLLQVYKSFRKRMVICFAFPLRFGQRLFHLRRIHTGNDVSIK
jgi:hypothetical protein